MDLYEIAAKICDQMSLAKAYKKTARLLYAQHLKVISTFTSRCFLPVAAKKRIRVWFFTSSTHTSNMPKNWRKLSSF